MNNPVPEMNDASNACSPSWSSNESRSFQPPLSNPILSLRNFASIGGGDASIPVTTMPRMRSQLFTISTKSVMESHSQLNISYIEQDCRSRSMSRSSVDSEIKPINSPPPYQRGEYGDDDLPNSVLSPVSSMTMIGNYDSSPSSSNLGRCHHSSMEDLRALPTSFAAIGNTNNCQARLGANVREEMLAAANDLLTEENRRLSGTVHKMNRRLLVTKISTWFVLEAVRHRARICEDLELAKRAKAEQCAARLILHSLLLNSWRNTKRELDMKITDNDELRKSVENLSLQVQVLRHIQTNERQKALEKTALIESTNEELKIIREENRILRHEIDKMENELNSLQGSTQSAQEENAALSQEIDVLIDTKNSLHLSLERERLRCQEVERECCVLRDECKQVQLNLDDATEQKTHWQENARCFESQAYVLKCDLEARDKTIKELIASCDSLRTEKLRLTELKSELQERLDVSANALQNMTSKNDELVTILDLVKSERDARAVKIEELEKSLEKAKKEIENIESELLSYKLQNVRRRRKWGNALYLIASPTEALKRWVAL